ncbi:hypothetical protein ABW20_dc0103286 [Dactylellina cionopaga]|nr:hypothetical protein ABW20_dc0103286 [Dactylellina cionopaga]
MEPLSCAASVIAVIQLVTVIAKESKKYIAEVKDARAEIESLREQIKTSLLILQRVQILLENPVHEKLETSRQLNDALLSRKPALEDLKAKLERTTAGKVMKKFGVRSLKWPLKKEEVEKIIGSLKEWERVIDLAIQLDQTTILIDIDRSLNRVRLPVAEGAHFESHADEHEARCLPQTRVDILEDIRIWVEDPQGKHLYWLCGMAGTGKSTIARTVAHSLKQRNQLGACFFFKQGQGDRGNASRFFTTLASDLITHLPQLRPEVRKVVEEDENISGKTLREQYENLVLHPLKRAKFLFPNPLKVVIVVDALDECEPGPQDRDILILLILLEELTKIKEVDLRIFLTGRPEKHLRNHFKKAPDGTYQNLLLHDIERKNVEHDIYIFLRTELAIIQKRQRFPDDWLGDEEKTIQTLARMATPLFIFAVTICRFLDDEEFGEERLETILHSPNQNVSQLDQTYLPIFHQLLVKKSAKEQETKSVVR